MKHRLLAGLHMLRTLCVAHKRLIIGVLLFGCLTLVIIVAGCNLAVRLNKKYILQPDNSKHVKVGLVLGAGITKNGQPFKELQARLDTAADALNNGKVEILLLSGDNRFKNYNEPDAMKDYLINTKHIPADKLQPDYAGRSTYESCERAHKIFGVEQTIIFSAGSHLPRAIYLCRSFGIEAYGIASGVEANNSTRRELVANVKAIYNVYINGENTILGPKIVVN